MVALIESFWLTRLIWLLPVDLAEAGVVPVLLITIDSLTLLDRRRSFGSLFKTRFLPAVPKVFVVLGALAVGWARLLLSACRSRNVRGTLLHRRLDPASGDIGLAKRDSLLVLSLRFRNPCEVLRALAGVPLVDVLVRLLRAALLGTVDGLATLALVRLALLFARAVGF